MIKENSSYNTSRFPTRDLIMMAVLAALGGVASTYINTLSDIVHAALGFPGATQWAAGLHALWIVLAMGIIRKPGTGILVGILKGAVELMSGNSHGVIILLVNIVAGLLVDFGFLLFKNKRGLLPYIIAGSLATGSNVLVFQLFATIPLNILGISAILILFLTAAVSGLLFAGILPYLLVNTLTKAGVIKAAQPKKQNRKIGWTLLSGVLILATLFAVFLITSYKGPEKIHITGAVDNSYAFPNPQFDPAIVNRQIEYRGVLTEYSGFLLSDIIKHAVPSRNADTLLIEASDGYTFLVSFEELESNPNILAVQQGQGGSASFDVVGPQSSKAWVRNVTKITVIAADGLTITTPEGVNHKFNPDDWVNDMDSTQIEMANGSQKLQGVPLWLILNPHINNGSNNEIFVFSETESLSFDWSEIKERPDLRIFTVIEENAISFALAEMSGEVHLFPVSKIEIR